MIEVHLVRTPFGLVFADENAMNVTLPIKVEIKAQGSSGFTAETIERRLLDLSSRLAAGDESAVVEIEYLRALKKRKGWE